MLKKTDLHRNTLQFTDDDDDSETGGAITAGKTKLLQADHRHRPQQQNSKILSPKPSLPDFIRDSIDRCSIRVITLHLGWQCDFDRALRFERFSLSSTQWQFVIASVVVIVGLLLLVLYVPLGQYSLVAILFPPSIFALNIAVASRLNSGLCTMLSELSDLNGVAVPMVVSDWNDLRTAYISLLAFIFTNTSIVLASLGGSNTVVQVLIAVSCVSCIFFFLLWSRQWPVIRARLRQQSMASFLHIVGE